MEDKKCYYYSEEKEKEVDKFCISKARLISDLNKYRGLLDEMKKESEYLDDTYLADDMDVYIADEMYCLERKMDDYQKWIKLMEKAFKFPGGFNKYTDALNVELEIKRNENKRTELLEQVNNVESKQKILKQELKKMLASEDQ